MAEIKSAIELAMERTKHLIMDKDEKEAFAIQEVEGKVKALLRRYMEDMADKDEVAKEYGLIKGDKRHKKSIVISFFMDQFDFQGDNKKLLSLFDLAGIDLPNPLKQEMEASQKTFQEEMEKRRQGMNERVVLKLKEMGIQGNGIVPNLEAWDDWKKEVKELEESFKGKLGKWKDALEGESRKTDGSS